MEDKKMNEKDISVINNNSIWDLTKGIIYSVIGHTLYFIEELEGDQKEFEEVIFIENLLVVEKEDYQTSVKEIEIEKLEKEKQITNKINITNKNSINDFLNECSAGVLKG